jgi:NAD(P)-dependent dehydrogenase (short-subunit alcohol dehydrogenase family)
MSDIPVVIVTGASRGVGASVARWLGKVGASVTLMARSSDPLKRVAQDMKRLGGLALTIPGDVADKNVCRRTVEKTIDRFGAVDALVNNAGTVQPLASVASGDEEAWRYNIEVNLLGPFHMTKAAIPHLRKQKGRIINVSSGAANIPVQSTSRESWPKKNHRSPLFPCALGLWTRRCRHSSVGKVSRPCHQSSWLTTRI